jgi:DNA polymerase-4
MSIDEMSCKLLGAERGPDRAMEIARRIKTAIRERAGDVCGVPLESGRTRCWRKWPPTCANLMGLVVLRDNEMPAALHRLALTDFPGIGPRMERRLNLYGIFTVQQLCAAPAKTLATVWGSRLIGEKWFRLLRGEDVRDKSGRRQTVSHSHILPTRPANRCRSVWGAGPVDSQGHGPVAEDQLLGGGVSIGVSYQGEPGSVPDPVGWGRAGWEAGCRFPHRQDTPGILAEVGNLWRGRPPGGVPFKVGMGPGRPAPGPQRDPVAISIRTDARPRCRMRWTTSTRSSGRMWCISAACGAPRTQRPPGSPSPKSRTSTAGDLTVCRQEPAFLLDRIPCQSAALKRSNSARWRS